MRLDKFPSSFVGNIIYLFFVFINYFSFFWFYVDFVSFLFGIIYTRFKTKNVSAILMHANNALHVLLGHENRPLIWNTLLTERCQIPYAVYYSALTNAREKTARVVSGLTVIVSCRSIISYKCLIGTSLPIMLAREVIEYLVVHVRLHK